MALWLYKCQGLEFDRNCGPTSSAVAAQTQLDSAVAVQTQLDSAVAAVRLYSASFLCVTETQLISVNLKADCSCPEFEKRSAWDFGWPKSN